MIIMDCDDPQRQQRHSEQLGVRIANIIRHDTYLGVQLHPKDTGGAMLEFNRTDGGEDLRGAYAPAGERWQQAIRLDVTRSLVSAEFDCPDAARFASRWSQILQRPARAFGAGGWRIELDTGRINFFPARVPEPVLAGVELSVIERNRVLDTAKARGCVVSNSAVEVCGVRFRLTQED